MVTVYTKPLTNDQNRYSGSPPIGRWCELSKTVSARISLHFPQIQECTRFSELINNSRTRPHKKDSWFCSALKNVFSPYSRIFNTKSSTFAWDNLFYSIIYQIAFISLSFYHHFSDSTSLTLSASLLSCSCRLAMSSLSFFSFSYCSVLFLGSSGACK
jgi:hypothetical protein